MTCSIIGRRTWSGNRDSFGQRDYKITFLIKSDFTDGPANVMETPGLPLPGSYWYIDGDVDSWAWCRWDADVKIHQEKVGDKNQYWTVELLFSTKPPGGPCRDQHITNPLLEPQRISGSFVKYTEEAVTDRFGRFLMTSSWEQFRGPHVEFDRNRPQVRIEQNVADLQLPLISALTDCVNDSPLWGLPPRCVKLSSSSWERKYYGLCYCYYTRVLEFDINFETFDRILVDEGNKVLNGHWHPTDGTFIVERLGNPLVAPDPLNPSHFVRFKDRKNENYRGPLNGAGLPAGVTISGPLVTVATACCPNPISRTLSCAIASEGVFVPPGVVPSNCSLLPSSAILTSTGGNLWVGRFTAYGGEWKVELRCNGNTCSGFELELYVPQRGNVNNTLQLHGVQVSCACSPLQLIFNVAVTGGAFGDLVCEDNVTFIIGEIRQTTSIGLRVVQKYNQGNFLLLNIPLNFNC